MKLRIAKSKLNKDIAHLVLFVKEDVIECVDCICEKPEGQGWILTSNAKALGHNEKVQLVFSTEDAAIGYVENAFKRMTE